MSGHSTPPEKHPKQNSMSANKLKNKPVSAQPRKVKPFVQPSKSKSLHPRNIHRNGYDFEILVQAYPSLTNFVRPNPFGNLSIDFADPTAVKVLNAALLKQYYGIDNWDIPSGFLCPPIPGRVDYIHYVADLLTMSGKIPKGRKVAVLDVGTGANGVYPLLGNACYGWRFVASDVDPQSIKNVEQIKALNSLDDRDIELRLQHDSSQAFKGIIKRTERYDLTLCNPPFHRSLAEATAGSAQKISNLAANQKKKGLLDKSTLASMQANLNFGGQKAELWCEGGEAQFLKTMILESSEFATQCLWFTSLVSKKENIKLCQQWLKKVGAQEVKVIEMAQGNKITRVIAWSYLPESQRQLWAKFRI